MRRNCAVAALCFCFSGWAHAASKPEPTDLALYAASSLDGIHNHSTDDEGRRLKLAEDMVARRREKVRVWLASRVGSETLERIDQEIYDEPRNLMWVRGPTIEQELENLRFARLSLIKLEQRKRRWEKDHR